MLRLTKRYPFSASHRLHSEQLSEEENQRLFGKCNNPFGHGHNYVLEVSVSGQPDPQSGLLIQRGELDAFVHQEVLAAVDHANLNSDVPDLQGMVPTTENLALVIHRRLRQAWDRRFEQRQILLERVRVEETGRNRFEVANGSDEPNPQLA